MHFSLFSFLFLFPFFFSIRANIFPVRTSASKLAPITVILSSLSLLLQYATTRHARTRKIEPLECVPKPLKCTYSLLDFQIVTVTKSARRHEPPCPRSTHRDLTPQPYGPRPPTSRTYRKMWKTQEVLRPQDLRHGPSVGSTPPTTNQTFACVVAVAKNPGNDYPRSTTSDRHQRRPTAGVDALSFHASMPLKVRPCEPFAHRSKIQVFIVLVLASLFFAILYLAFERARPTTPSPPRSKRWKRSLALL